jgi:hypothetical protein
MKINIGFSIKNRAHLEGILFCCGVSRDVEGAGPPSTIPPSQGEPLGGWRLLAVVHDNAAHVELMLFAFLRVSNVIKGARLGR